MAAKNYDVLFLGGGTAGISGAAFLLRQTKKYSIGIIEPSEWHYYQPAWTLVGGGIYDIEKTRRPEKDYIPAGADWIKSRAKEIRPDDNVVVLDNGEEVGYKVLVVTLGVTYLWDEVPGMREALDTPYASTNYLYDYAPKTWELLKNFKGGKALFTVPHTPYKCGAAPQKIMYLADEIFRKNGVRDKSEIHLYSPGSVFFGVPGFGETIARIAQEKDVEGHFFHKLVEVKPQERVAVFENTQNGDRVEEQYDFIHLVPPQGPPAVVKDNAALTEGAEQPGFLNVDRHTLQHKKYPNIFGIGDACGVPFAKAGAAIRKQVGNVIPNMLEFLAGKAPSNRYNGYSGCPFVVGYGKLVMAEFLYDNVPAPSFPKWLIDTTKPSYLMWLMKVYFLPWMYWNRMLYGRMIDK